MVRFPYLPESFFGVGSRLRVRRAVGIAFHRDGGHGDYGTLGELRFEVLVSGLAIREQKRRV